MARLNELASEREFLEIRAKEFYIDVRPHWSNEMLRIQIESAVKDSLRGITRADRVRATSEARWPTGNMLTDDYGKKLMDIWKEQMGSTAAFQKPNTIPVGGTSFMVSSPPMPSDPAQWGADLLYDSDGNPLMGSPLEMKLESARKRIAELEATAREYSETIKNQRHEFELYKKSNLELDRQLDAAGRTIAEQKRMISESHQRAWFGSEYLLATADRAFRFFAGLCLTDQPVSVQREYENVMRELKDRLRKATGNGGRDH